MGCAGSKAAATTTSTGNATNANNHKKSIKKEKKTPNNPPPKVNYGERTDGPRDVICHICGRKYTVHSINQHIPQCENLWNQRQAKEHAPSKCKPCPVLPKKVERMTLDARNELATQIYNDAVLEQCRFCERRFLPDRLEVHLPVCAKNHGQDWPPRPVAHYNVHKRTEASNTVICHICGRKYTIHSIDIHVPQCEQKWHNEQAQKPAKQRKPVPQLPKRYRPSQRNLVATKVYEQAVLEKCPHCGRTFLPDRLEVHLRSCRSARHEPARRHAK